MVFSASMMASSAALPLIRAQTMVGPPSSDCAESASESFAPSFLISSSPSLVTA